MWRRSFEFIGVDYDQWLALVRVSLKIDFRVAAMRSTFQQRSDSGSGALIGLLVIALMTGTIFGVIAWLSKDVFFSGTVFLSYVMFMIGAMVLIEFHSVVISPDDYSILGYQPLSSRTYLLAKLTNVLFYTTVITTALGLVPFGAYFFARGFNPLLGLAAVVATYLASAGVTLAMILLYAGILRWVHPNKLRRALSYLQLALSFFIYGGYVFVPEMIDSKALASFSLTKVPWLFLHPATWFASYLDLAIGRWGFAEILPALASFVALGALVSYAGGKLSLDYSERLSVLTTTSESQKKIPAASGRWLSFFRLGEARAVALLVRNQFKYDQKFRLAVLGILPLTLFYLFMSLREGPLPDPFVRPELDRGRSGLLYFAILLFPWMLKATLESSDSYQASWIFYATPASKERLVLSVKNFIMAYFVLPYLVLIGAVFSYFYQNVLHALLHLSVLALWAHLFLQIAILLKPNLPFSQPVRKGEHSAHFFVLGILTAMVAMIVLPLLVRKIYPHGKLLFALLGSLGLLTLMLEQAVKARVNRRSQNLEFQG